MCGRYTLTKTDILAEYYDLETVPETVEPNYNVAPTQTMPVVLQVNGRPELQMMRWGIPRFIGPGKVKDAFNTRADKAFWTWKKITMSQRVLIPATGFYEWKAQAGGKQPYFIHPKERPLFSFAGIWTSWQADNGPPIQTYSIITTEPNEEMLDIHNRMPVILHRQDESTWLSHDTDNDTEQLAALLLPYDDEGLEIFEVSKDVNVVQSNEVRLIMPLNSQ